MFIFCLFRFSIHFLFVVWMFGVVIGSVDYLYGPVIHIKFRIFITLMPICTIGACVWVPVECQQFVVVIFSCFFVLFFFWIPWFVSQCFIPYKQFVIAKHSQFGLVLRVLWPFIFLCHESDQWIFQLSTGKHENWNNNNIRSKWPHIFSLFILVAVQSKCASNAPICISNLQENQCCCHRHCRRRCRRLCSSIVHS